jgi:anti-sigma B factor antagonist
MRAASMSSGVGDFRIEEETPFPSTEETPFPSTTVLHVHGDADLHSAPELRDRLSDAIRDGATTLVVDLSETALVDSTSLGVLLKAVKQLREQDGQLVLVVPRPELRRVFEITMLDRIFVLHETREEALAASSNRAG